MWYFVEFKWLLIYRLYILFSDIQDQNTLISLNVLWMYIWLFLLWSSLILTFYKEVICMSIISYKRGISCIIHSLRLCFMVFGWFEILMKLTLKQNVSINMYVLYLMNTIICWLNELYVSNFWDQIVCFCFWCWNDYLKAT